MNKAKTEQEPKGDTDNDTTPRENKELIHISQVKIPISGVYMTLEQIQEKSRKEKENEKIRKD